MKKKEWISLSLILFMSYCFTYILTNYYFLKGLYVSISSNSLFAILSLAIVSFLLRRLQAERDRRLICCTIWASFVFALIVVLSKPFAEDYAFDLSLKTFIVFLILWCLIEAMLLFLYDYFLEIKIGKDNLDNLFTIRKNIFWVWAVMLLCWFPALLAMFPGNFAYDAWPQVAQMQLMHQLNSAHPILHTLFLNACLFVGDSVFKSYNIGLLIYCIVQSVLLSGMFTLCIYKLYQWRTGTVVVVGTFLFFAFNPIIQVFAFTTTKDVLFSGMFLLVIVFSFEIIKDPEEFFSTRADIIRYAVSVILMCMLRNQGKYVFMVFIPFMAISVKNYRKKWLLLGISLVISINLIMGPISTAFGIEKGNMREMLSVPMQQIARVWNMNPSSITEEENKIITGIIPAEYLERYDEYSADPVKSGFNIQAFKKNMLKFLNIWINLGLKNPVIYLESFFFGAYQYWYIGPRLYGYDGVFYDGSFMDAQYDTLKITRHTLLPVYDNYLRNMTNGHEYNRFPVLSIVMNMAFPFWLMIIGISILMYMRRYKYISVFILPIGYWGTCLLGPVAMLRYDLPLIVGIPLYIGIVLAVKRDYDKLNSVIA